jgi:hypothetical protein
MTGDYYLLMPDTTRSNETPCPEVTTETVRSLYDGSGTSHPWQQHKQPHQQRQ